MKVVARWSAVLALAATSAGRLTATEAPLQQLVDASPFAEKDSSGPAQPAAPSLEFRGYFRESGEMLFSVYDNVNRRGTWLKLNDSLGDIVVRQFQPDSEELSVEQNGRTLRLPLKASVTATINSPPAGSGAAAKVSPSPTRANAAPDGNSSPAVQAAEAQLATAQQQQAYEERRQRALERIKARTKTPPPRS